MSISILGSEAIVTILVASFLPAFAWLWFWLKEDEFPEPRRLLAVAFIGGILIIPLALILEFGANTLAKKVFPESVFETPTSLTQESAIAALGLVVVFALIEEFVKYVAALLLIFWRKEYDEPADAMIYMITTALGFAAGENIFYLVRPFSSTLLHGIGITNLRFLGPVLLHALSSGVLGYFIAGAFYKGRMKKEYALAWGLFFSTTLHALFNISILMTGGERIEPALALLIIAGIFILFSFERIKHKMKQYYA